MEYRYILEKCSKKYICPNPNCRIKSFVRYIDTTNQEYLPECYGRCDREMKCGYWLNPYKDGYIKKLNEQDQVFKRPSGASFNSKPVCSRPPVFIPAEILKATMRGWDQNTFIQNLLNRIPFPMDAKDVSNVICLYQLGTICKGSRTGSVTFPFIDVNQNIRAIQVKQFDTSTHTTNTDFLHSIIERHHQGNSKPLPVWLSEYLQNEKKVTCLFGEHLLNKYPNNPVALVEAPKTAIIGTLYFGFPEKTTDMLWLAVYNLSSLNYEKCKVLGGRRVYLFPDLSEEGRAFELWSKAVQQFAHKIPEAHFKISQLLEQKADAEDRINGLDLADYLLRLDWKLFR